MQCAQWHASVSLHSFMKKKIIVDMNAWKLLYNKRLTGEWGVPLRMFHYLPRNLYLHIAFPALRVDFVPNSLTHGGNIPLKKEWIQLVRMFYFPDLVGDSTQLKLLQPMFCTTLYNNRLGWGEDGVTLGKLKQFSLQKKSP